MGMQSKSRFEGGEYVRSSSGALLLVTRVDDSTGDTVVCRRVDSQFCLVGPNMRLTAAGLRKTTLRQAARLQKRDGVVR